MVPWKDTIDYCCSFLGTTINSIEAEGSDEKAGFARHVNWLSPSKQRKDGMISRETIISKLEIPAAFFVERGYGETVLRSFDVGLCTDQSKSFFNRVVVPVYDETGRNALGFSGRTIHPQCANCKLWHTKGATCPSKEKALAFSKWRHSAGFAREATFYNLRALPQIRKSGVVVLTEGPADVWRLEEAGVTCGLALLGSSLSEQQQILLEMSGAMTVVVATDMDEAGRSCASNIQERLRRSFRVVAPDLPKHDVGEMTVDDVRSTFGRWTSAS
jgi:5S rRNA maturation endonuclease (ribonuclease M5)